MRFSNRFDRNDISGGSSSDGPISGGSISGRSNSGKSSLMKSFLSSSSVFRLRLAACSALLALSLWVSCSAQAPSQTPQRSAAYAAAYAEGLDFLERYRLRQAERAFQRCVVLDGRAYEGLWQLGRLRLLQGRIEEGKALLDSALVLRPDLEAVRQLVVETYMGRGHEALEEGRYAQAGLYFSSALRTHPQGYGPLHGAAVAALWSGDDAAADSLLRRGIEAHPARPELRWHLKALRQKHGGPPVADPYRFADAVKVAKELGGRFVETAVGVDKLDGGRASAWADFDGDADLDLAVIGHPDLAYYRNDGGHFSDATVAAGLSLPQGGIGVQTADYDNDGDADLYVTRDGWFGGGRNYLFDNDGQGRFSEVAEKAGADDPGSSFCAAWADYDNDGWLDLYVADGTGASGDSTNVLYRNLGDGTFRDMAVTAGVASPRQSLSAAWGDLDSDGDADLYVCNFTQANQYYRNLGDGTFVEAGQEAGLVADHVDGFITFMLDYNNDGDLDVFVGNWSEFDTVLADRLAGGATQARQRPVLYRNLGDGTFEDVTEKAGLARALGTMSGVPGDIDNDGWVDLYLGNGGPKMQRREPDVLYRNLGDGTFEDATRAVGLGHTGKSHGVTFADYDADGDLDLYLPVGGARPGDQWHNVLYRNEGFGNNWIGFRLQGRQSNRDGIGARLRLVAGGRARYAEVASGYSFGNSSSLEVEFGLGKTTKAEVLEVHWPSGQVDRFSDIKGGRYWTLVEGAAVPLEVR
jgi:tetratricopeptide (TPR) repeat protein